MKKTLFLFVLGILIIIGIIFTSIQFKKILTQSNDPITIIDTIYQNTITIDTVFIFSEKITIDTFTIYNTIYDTIINTDLDSVIYKQIFTKSYYDTLLFNKTLEDSISKFDIKMEILHKNNLSILSTVNLKIKLINDNSFTVNNFKFISTIINKRTIKSINKTHLFVFSNFGTRTNIEKQLYLTSPSIGILYNKNKYLLGIDIGTDRVGFNIGWKLW